MIAKEEFYFRSSDEIHRIHAVRWVPDGEVKAVIQINHGMCEHIDRYDAFARMLASEGYVVTGHDMLGHGLSVRSKDELGYYCDYLGNAKLISDVLKLKCITAKEYSNVPYYLMGHCMGSLLVRQYLSRYQEGIDGAILMSTEMYPSPLIYAGIGFLKLISLLHPNKGMKHKGNMINSIAMGWFDRSFKEEKNRSTWYSSVEEEVIAFNHDPLCRIDYSIGAYKDLLEGLLEADKQINIDRMHDDIPMILLGGSDDPITKNGKCIKKVYKKYKKASLNVRMRLYKGCRHALVHEYNADKVCRDIIKWIELQDK